MSEDSFAEGAEVTVKKSGAKGKVIKCFIDHKGNERVMVKGDKWSQACLFLPEQVQ